MGPFSKLFRSSLGPDFWKFRLGQLVSLLGNGCRSVAMAWWVLEKTGSAKAIATVLVPAMIVNLTLLLFFGPLGDNFSRKKLIVIGDLGRFVISGCIVAMVYFDYFNLDLLAGLFILLSIGTALYNSSEAGILPRLVENKKLQTAYQQSYAINSFGGVAGGIVGGIVVSLVGILGAFSIDAFSFLIAGLSSNLIQADTVPKRKRKASALKTWSNWRIELFDGFRILFKIPVLFWVCLSAMIFNFVQAPFWVVLPVFAKMVKNMPAWYLGGLEGSIALGAIAGSLSLGFMQGHMNRRMIVFYFLGIQALFFLFLPRVPGVVLPMVLLFGVGFGSSIVNVQFDTQLALVIPDSHRSRLNSIIEFLCLGLYPLGMAIGSLSIAQLGLTATLEIMGIVGLVLAPNILFIPKLKELMEVRANKAGGFLKKHYPEVIF